MTADSTAPARSTKSATPPILHAQPADRRSVVGAERSSVPGEQYLLLCQQVSYVGAMAHEPARRRTQEERRSASEEALLDAAAELIAEVGIERASFPKISDRAGTSRGLPTHYFGSKDALVDRLAHRTQERILDHVTGAIHHARGGQANSGLDHIRLSMGNYLALFEHPTAETRALIVMWSANFPAEADLPAMRQADQRTYDGWADAIRRGQRDGSIRADLDIAATTSTLLALSRGFAALLLADSEVIEAAGVRATCDQWITTVMAADTAA